MSGQSRFQPISVENVAACFVRSITEPKSIGHICDLCGDEILTLTEIIAQILAVTGRRRWKVRVPLRVARLQAAALESVFPMFLGKAPPLNRDQLLMLQEDNLGDGQLAKALFGIEPVSFAEGIDRYLRPRTSRGF